ncbi:hypothetical protein COU56_01945 [Candidatus Pacearchaeota archaeon CG10_big_fil_rev_8_21_14_0_10_31_9]|nr:MAG: hypothetical protein COU56_01945 [Candidatus Pacearchaeota archaeon CG10_big_fil_rev_8_21_14_0_10_31_9]
MVGVSVVLPCLNEEQGVGICISKIQSVFKEHTIDGEIIIVDNGCTDGTINTVKSFKGDNIKIVNQPKKGYGNAYLAGFKETNGEIIVIGDADNSYDFYDIPRFLDEIDNGYDFVIGNRVFIQKGAMPSLHKYVGKPLFSFLLNFLFKINVSDSHCGFGCIKKESLKRLDLKSHGMEFASEILIKARKANLRIGEIPISYSPRLGASKLRTLQDGTRHLILITKEFVSQIH